MSGHSKWSTIKHKKGATDAQRGKIFTKMSQEIAVAVKEGGSDPSMNSKLRDLIAKAKYNNVPSDNIERAIKKAAGDTDKNHYENIIYEGDGPLGVAVIVETLTDNRNRTAGEVRHYFDKSGGNLGTTGCVSFMFETKGFVFLDRNSVSDEELIMENAIIAGAVDVQLEEDGFVVETEPNSLTTVREAMEEKGYVVLNAEIQKIPETTTPINDEEVAIKMNRLLEMLEENEDVQMVWTNWENPIEGE